MHAHWIPPILSVTSLGATIKILLIGKGEVADPVRVLDVRVPTKSLPVAAMWGV